MDDDTGKLGIAGTSVAEALPKFTRIPPAQTDVDFELADTDKAVP